jgi:hypothetical protein
MTIYFFPKEDKRIEADSLEEAQKKLKEEQNLSSKKIENADNKDMANAEKSNKSIKTKKL